MELKKYGISGTSPEAYVALAVEHLIETVGKEALHAEGSPTMEYLEMLSLYAIHYAHKHLSRKETGGGIAEWAYENYDPESMSEDLVRCLTDLLS